MEADPDGLIVTVYEILREGQWVVVSIEEYDAWTGEKAVNREEGDVDAG